MDKRPIGIFDSGLGGLSAVKAMFKYMPNEDIIYFGDTGRVPYGTRSEKIIEQYAKEDISFLEKFGCKLIIAACGTVSSTAKNAISAVKEPFIEVVTPAAIAAAKATKNNCIGVMGTSATINSKAFVKAIEKINPDISVTGVSCPLLVSLVENNSIDSDNKLAYEMISRYIKPLIDNGVDTIILGCTHFPHLAPVVSQVAGADITLIDTGHEAVLAARATLEKNNLLNDCSHNGTAKYYITDKTQNFSDTANTLLGMDISSQASFIDLNSFRPEMDK